MISNKNKYTLSLDNFENILTPFSHTVFDNVLSITFHDFEKELNKIKKSDFIINKNINFQKKELRSIDGFIGKIMNELISDDFLKKISSIYSFKNLTSDPSFDGGGLTISEPGSYLRYHADFPYSNISKKYRVLNAILYLSDPNIIGGNLHLLDYQSGTVEANIRPTFGKLIVFPTSKYTIHGFSKILYGNRVTINTYLYDDKPIDDRLEPSKTIWFNN